MPRMDGREVLIELVADPALAHLPVVILTTSSEEREILAMYRHRCSSYIVKPVDFEKFVQRIRLIGEFRITWRARLARKAIQKCRAPAARRGCNSASRARWRRRGCRGSLRIVRGLDRSACARARDWRPRRAGPRGAARGR